jgi:DNA-binding IclR family transcriptional regulator
MAKAATGEPMRSATRLLDILVLFTEDRPKQTAAEISQQLQLAPSTVRRLLQVLESRGFVRQDHETKQYRLHLRLLPLAAAARAGFDIVRLAAPILDRLSEQTEETIQLSIYEGGQVVQVDNRPSKHVFRIFHPVGHRLPLHTGSAQAKVILADLKPDEVRALLPASGSWSALTQRTITNADDLLRHLDQVRKQGYAVNDGETEPDVWAVAAPVYDHANAVIAAINIPSPQSRITPERAEELTAAAVSAADEFSQILRYAPSVARDVGEF